MSESESARMVQATSVDIPAPVAETMRRAGASNDWLSADRVSQAARQAVAAWAMAADGDDTALTAIAQPDAAYWLMHPVRKPWQVAPGPRVSRIEIRDLEAHAEPARLRITFQFAGRRQYEDPGPARRAADAETVFVGLLDLELAGSGSWPWRLSSGHVETLDDFLGYVFTSRRETAQEYGQRTSSSHPAALGPGHRFRLRASFAEHDERFGSSVEIEVVRQAAPDRNEAVGLVWPAIEEETWRALGEGDWRPSLSSLEVVELRDEQPGIDNPPEPPAAFGGMTGQDFGGMPGQDQASLRDGVGRALRRPWQLTDIARMSVDAFAERYARSRQLTYELNGTTPGGSWFLSSIYPKRSHSFMRGPLAGGPQGLLWYAEKVLRAGRGRARQSWTVVCYDLAAPGGSAAGIACVPRQNPLWGGRLKLVSILPRELTPVAVGDAKFDQSYEVGIVGDTEQASISGLFTADFTAWMCELPFGKFGADSTRFEVRAGTLCVYTRGAQRTTQTLDAFCQRAARIAAQVQRTWPPPG
jgi:hypothetical protein